MLKKIEKIYKETISKKVNPSYCLNYRHPGFFFGNHILCIGLAPGQSWQIKDTNDINKMLTLTDIFEHEKMYYNILKRTKITNFVNKLIGNNWNHISYTNIFSDAIKDNENSKIKKIDSDKYLIKLNEKIKLVNPNIIIIFGRKAGEIILKDKFQFNKIIKKDDNYYYTCYHPAYFYRQSKENTEEYINNMKKDINDFLKTYAIIRVTEDRIYYRDIEYNRKFYNNTYENSFYFTEINKNEKDSIFSSYDGRKLKLIKKTSFYSNSLPIAKSYEAHLKKKNLFYYNNYTKIRHSKNIHYCVLDIETDFSRDMINTPKPVTSVCVYDSLNKNYTVFVLNKNNQTIYKRDDANIFIYQDEIILLKDVFNFLKNFDLITGWFVQFDLSYFFNRGISLGINLRDYFRDLRIVMNDRDEIMMFSELIFYDALEFYRKLVYFNKPPSYSLNDVAKHLLNEEKVQHEGVDILWRSNINKLIQYNLKDVVLTKKIIEIIDAIEYPLQLQQFCPQDFENTFYNSKTIENLLHYFCWPNNIFLPTKKTYPKLKYTGALVLEPVPGFHTNVGAYDFASMYTTIYITFNISPDTLVGKKEDVENNFDNVIKDLEDRYPKAKEFFVERQYNQSKILKDFLLLKSDFGNHYFLPHEIHQGILPRLEKYLIEKRRGYERKRDSIIDTESLEYKMLDDLQGCFKTVLNSVFGITSYSKFILYNPIIASSITAIAREMLMFVKELSVKNNFNPLLGDSVTRDTTLLIKYKKKKLLITCSELPFLIPNKKLYKKDKIAYKFTENVYTQSYNFKTKKVEFKKIKYFITHKINKNIYNISSKFYSFNVTEDHGFYNTKNKLMSVNEFPNRIKYEKLAIRPKCCNIGNLNFSNMIKEINLFDLSKNCIDYYMKKTFTNSYSKCKISKDKKYFYLYFFNRLNINYKTLKFPLKIKLDSNFGYILGAYIAEGSTTSKGKLVSGFRIMANDKEYVKKIYNKLIKIFGKNLIHLSSDKVRISGGNFVISNLFRKIGGYKCAGKKLPNFILETNKDFFLSILDGYTYGDGQAAFRSKNKEDYINLAGVGSKSKKLVSQTYFIMKNIFKLSDIQLRIRLFRLNKNFYGCEWNKKAIRCSHAVLQLKEIITPFYNEVFDIEVEDNHNFIDILGGIILHNTDSLFVSLNTVSKEESMNKGFKFENYLNNELKNFILLHTSNNNYLNHNELKIHLEKLYNTFILTDVKKRYIGKLFYRKGKTLEPEQFSVTGFESRRDDTPEFFKKELNRFYEFILGNYGRFDFFTLLKHELKKSIKKLKDIKDITELVIRIKLSRDIDDYQKNIPIHLRALKNSSQIIRRGNVVNMIYVKTKDEVTHLSDPENQNEFLKIVDFDKYAEKFLTNKIILVLKLLLNESAIAELQDLNQKNLDSYLC